MPVAVVHDDGANDDALKDLPQPLATSSSARSLASTSQRPPVGFELIVITEPWLRLPLDGSLLLSGGLKRADARGQRLELDQDALTPRCVLRAPVLRTLRSVSWSIRLSFQALDGNAETLGLSVTWCPPSLLEQIRHLTDDLEGNALHSTDPIP